MTFKSKHQRAGLKIAKCTNTTDAISHCTDLLFAYSVLAKFLTYLASYLFRYTVNYLKITLHNACAVHQGISLSTLRVVQCSGG